MFIKSHLSKAGLLIPLFIILFAGLFLSLATNVKASNPTPTQPTTIGICYSSTRQYGDANCDSQYTLADFVIWKDDYRLFQTTGLDTDYAGNFNDDSAVDLVDFRIWKDSYIRAQYATPTATKEPPVSVSVTINPTISTPFPTNPTLPTSIITKQCDWCGNVCGVKSGSNCPDVMPPAGYECKLVDTMCKAVPSDTVNQ